MYPTTLALVLAFWILNFALLADAGIYVLKPSAGSKCHGGQTCTIEWLDDGSQPLLSAAGVCTFGLFTGKQQLVQAIAPADVSTAHSVTFKPNPAAGPNSDAYYIGIISTTFKKDSDTPYMAFSPFFSIDQMSGSFDTPLPAAISAIPIPSSLTRSATGSGTATSRSTTKLSTITAGDNEIRVYFEYPLHFVNTFSDEDLHLGAAIIYGVWDGNRRTLVSEWRP
ncbi:hypothetical protein FPV67DRAFT_1672707 [Lyophyllum atratum]|nr:hypothetical protein FPV67DRAFT_1672707 [Lyophyllum atratum]